MTLAEACERFSAGKSDVIIMSFVISSLSERPDFLKLARLLTDDGILIIAEADPAYSAIKPYYSFKTENGSIALKTNPIHHLELKTLCERGGLKECAVHPVTKHGVIYSYVAVFEKVRP
jgi:ubiquinone/menaquinone biosynthesis C-methylase UbiE